MNNGPVYKETKKVKMGESSLIVSTNSFGKLKMKRYEFYVVKTFCSRTVQLIHIIVVRSIPYRQQRIKKNLIRHLLLF